MRQLPAGMQAHLDGGATTLCRCWRLTRADGAVFGFTDHDRDLSVDGTLFEAQAGFEATEMVSTLGLGVDNLDAAGALTSERLSEQALAAGLFDNATVEIFIVNWADTAQILLVRSGNLGEVTRSDHAFKAEIRGLAHVLNQPEGRVFQFPCHADLGDARCGVDLDGPAFHGDGTVAAAIDKRRFTANGLGGFAAGWFERGRLAWTGGANAGRAMEVRAHRTVGGVVTIELWQPMHFAVTGGDAFTVTAGCDKLFATCKAKFDNAVNFRGFPHMPGSDFALSYARAGDVNDGGPVVG